MEKSRGKQNIACPGVSGGAEGSRTPVRKHFDRTFSGRSPVSTFPPCADTGQTAQFSRVIVHGRGNSYPPHVRHINDAFPGLWPLRFRRLPLVRQRQQYDCCQLIFKLPVLWRSGAAARLSSLHTPVETGTPPYICSRKAKGFPRMGLRSAARRRQTLRGFLSYKAIFSPACRKIYRHAGRIRFFTARRDPAASPAPGSPRPWCPR